jgi:Flp pilus assembly protein TadG
MVAQGFLSRLRALQEDRRGVSAVEFALIAPVMIGMLFGSADLSLALMADRKVTLAVSTVTDLVAQDDTVNCAELDRIFSAATAILAPFSTTPATLRVTMVDDNGGSPRAVWSDTAEFGAIGTCNPTPAAVVTTSMSTHDARLRQLVTATNGVVMGEISYAFPSNLTNMVGYGPITMTETFFLRPRRTPEITLIN